MQHSEPTTKFTRHELATPTNYAQQLELLQYRLPRQQPVCYWHRKFSLLAALHFAIQITTHPTYLVSSAKLAIRPYTFWACTLTI